MAARLEGLPCPAFLAGQAAFLQRGQLGSTAALVLEAARAAGRAPVAQVFDGEPRRREAWRGLEGVEVLPGQEGREALEAAGPADLLLLDPYDLFETWGALLPRARPLCREGVLLLYLFNKAPRGAGHQRQYAALRRALREAISPGQRLLVGRVASDAVLPRAFHEVLLLGPAELVSPWEAPLGQVTRALAAELASRGAWEAEGG